MDNSPNFCYQVIVRTGSATSLNQISEVVWGRSGEEVVGCYSSINLAKHCLSILTRSGRVGEIYKLWIDDNRRMLWVDDNRRTRMFGSKNELDSDDELSTIILQSQPLPLRSQQMRSQQMRSQQMRSQQMPTRGLEYDESDVASSGGSVEEIDPGDELSTESDIDFIVGGNKSSMLSLDDNVSLSDSVSLDDSVSLSDQDTIDSYDVDKRRRRRNRPISTNVDAVTATDEIGLEQIAVVTAVTAATAVTAVTEDRYLPTPNFATTSKIVPYPLRDEYMKLHDAHNKFVANFTLWSRYADEPDQIDRPQFEPHDELAFDSIREFKIEPMEQFKYYRSCTERRSAAASNESKTESKFGVVFGS